MHAGWRMLPLKRQQGSGSGWLTEHGRAVRPTWKLGRRRHVPTGQDREGLPHGLPLQQSLSPSISLGERLVSIQCPHAAAPVPGRRSGFALCLLLPTLPEGSGFWGGSGQLQRACKGTHMPFMGLWGGSAARGILKPLGHICSLSERGAELG